MADHKQEDDRWRELADLLGLPESGAEASKPAARPEPPAPAPEPPAIKAYEEPPALRAAPMEDEVPRLEERDSPTIPMPRAEVQGGWDEEIDDEVDTPLDEEAASGDVGEELSPEEAALEQGPPRTDEERPRRGRRRRRRGRRRGGDRGDGDGADRRPGGPREHDADGRDRQDRGDRGRGRRRDGEDPRGPQAPRREPVERAEPADTVHDEPPARAPRVPSSDTDFSDWNVPSWQELISALYRPDR
jgi:hypothetical protein